MISTEQVNKSNEEEIKKLYQQSKLEQAKLEFRVDGSIWKDGKPTAEEPTYEEKAWFVSRMRGPARSWEVWYQ
jgi:hypothetical protein